MLTAWGVVLLHGKWDTPAGAIAPLGDALAAAGARVHRPACTWTPARFYDIGFEAALEEIEGEVDALRQRGASRILLAGHSLGANAALAAGRRPICDALALVAPGHFPDRLFDAGETPAALETARNATPGRRIRLPDYNQGQLRELRFDPSIWLSFFDPGGPAVMAASARCQDSPRPVLWASAKHDPLARGGRAYAFDLLPPHPQNFWLELDAGHLDAPAFAAKPIVDWLHSLEATP